jgi:peptidoglycan hydrolase CwlO-like protein
MKKLLSILKDYIGYFLAVVSAIGIIYGIGVFFANIQSDIKTVVNTLSEIKSEQTNQSEKIKSIEYKVISISSVQAKQGSFNNAIDKSYRDHLKMSKDLIDEYTKYLEMQIENGSKKSYIDSVMSTFQPSIRIEKIK